MDIVEKCTFLNNFHYLLCFSWENCLRARKTPFWSSWTLPRGWPWRRGWSLATDRSENIRTLSTSPRSRWTGPEHSLKVQRSVTQSSVSALHYTGASYSNMLYKHTNNKKTKKIFFGIFFLTFTFTILLLENIHP